jgi:fructokinase
MSKKIVCFGEMLWDCFPGEDIPGGAPMNVALNLRQLGFEVKMISSLGKDDYGLNLRNFISTYDLDQSLIQETSEYPTGKVLVDQSDPENILYEIVAPAAWDYIQPTAEGIKEVREADAFVYGSLSVRNQESWDTLYELIHLPVLKIFDINLRAPFYDFSQIDIILGYSDILKINEDELSVLAQNFNLPDNPEAFCKELLELYPLKLICVTLGAKGAMIYSNNKFYHHSGYKVNVKDTVGSGDAFLSGLIKTYLERNSPDKILDFACALGAFVATQRGGTPRYTLQNIHALQTGKA